MRRTSSTSSRDVSFWMRSQRSRHIWTRSRLARSLSESTFSMMKATFGDSLRSKTDTAQVIELLCKVLWHNLCCPIQSFYELGSEPVF